MLEQRYAGFRLSQMPVSCEGVKSLQRPRICGAGVVGLTCASLWFAVWDGKECVSGDGVAIPWLYAIEVRYRRAARGYVKYRERPSRDMGCKMLRLDGCKAHEKPRQITLAGFFFARICQFVAI